MKKQEFIHRIYDSINYASDVMTMREILNIMRLYVADSGLIKEVREALFEPEDGVDDKKLIDALQEKVFDTNQRQLDFCFWYRDHLFHDFLAEPSDEDEGDILDEYEKWVEDPDSFI